MKLVKLPDGTFVNPEFVTSIEFTSNTTKVWVVGHAGYHTFSVSFMGDMRDELMQIITSQRDYRIRLSSHGGAKIKAIKWVMDSGELIDQKPTLLEAKHIVDCVCSEQLMESVLLPFLFTKQEANQVVTTFYSKCPYGHIDIEKV